MSETHGSTDEGSRRSKDCFDAEREAARWALAERLHAKMEQYDPSGPAEDHTWLGLSDDERDFFYLCVSALFEDLPNARRALE